MFKYLLLFCLFLSSTVSAAEIDGCTSYKTFAHQAMLIRQANEPIDNFIEQTKIMLNKHKVHPDIQTNLVNIIIGAYRYPYIENLDVAVQLVDEYSIAVYNACANETSLP